MNAEVVTIGTELLLGEIVDTNSALITARCALEQVREVFAIPGSLHNPLARGCHQLIRQGAKLVENIQDIIEELGPLSEAALSSQTALSRRENTIKSSSGTFKIDEQQTYVLDCLGSDPTSIDTLVERSGLTAEALSSILLVLELHNQVVSVPGGAYIRLGQEEMK